MSGAPGEPPSWTTSRHRSIAWVDGLVFGDSSGRDFRGFTMPYVDTYAAMIPHLAD